MRARRTLPEPTPLAWRGVLALLAGAALVGACVGWVTSARAQEVERYSPSTRSPRYALERAEVVDLAAEVFGSDVRFYVARIVACESSNRPGARSHGWDRVFGRYDQRGLLQIESTLWLPLAVELTGSDDLYDPRVNLVTARAIQREQGWRAWPWCSR